MKPSDPSMPSVGPKTKKQRLTFSTDWAGGTLFLFFFLLFFTCLRTVAHGRIVGCFSKIFYSCRLKGARRLCTCQSENKLTRQRRHTTRAQPDARSREALVRQHGHPINARGLAGCEVVRQKAYVHKTTLSTNNGNSPIGSAKEVDKFSNQIRLFQECG
jgi:hypothetical protein